MQPPMDLFISKLILLHCTASNDVVQIKRSVCHSSDVSSSFSVTDNFQVCQTKPMVVGWFISHLHTLHFLNSDCLHISIRGTSFSLGSG